MATASKVPLGRKIAGAKRRIKSDREMVITLSNAPKKSARGKSVKFGSVTVRGYALGQAELTRNLEQGRVVVQRLKGELVKPGVSLKARAGTPLYHADPDRPDRLIRVLDGRVDRGYFEGTVFKPA